MTDEQRSELPTVAGEFDANTDSLPASERREYWRQSLARVFSPAEVELAEGSLAQGKLQSMLLGNAQLVSLESSAHRLHRTHPLMNLEIQTERKREFTLTYQLHGLTVLRQQGHTLLIRPGQFAVTDLGRPFEFIVNGHHARAALTLPFDALTGVINEIDDVLGIAIDASEGAARLLRSVLDGFFFNRGLLGPFDRLSAGTFVRDLVAATLRHNAPTAPSLAERSMNDLIAFIEHNLRDPDLTPAVVAASQFMSVRTLQLMFQSHGWTPSAWIRHRRMQHAMHDLAASEQDLTVSDVARRWGFSSLPHFSRLFRQAIGMSPREYRAVSLERNLFQAPTAPSTSEEFFRLGRSDAPSCHMLPL